MQIRNIADVPRDAISSPKGKFAAEDQDLSISLGRDFQSTDLVKRHPFDVAITTVPAGKARCPYHAHSAQWEFYHVLAGSGVVRHEGGTEKIGPGDFFLFRPGEAHQLIASADEALTYYVVADNPFGEGCYYPDSKKWSVRIPERRLIRSEPLDYHDGEE